MKNLSFLSLLFIGAFLISCSEKNDIAPDATPPEAVGDFTVLKSGSLNRQSGTNTRGQVQLIENSEGKFFIRLTEDFTTKFSTGTVTVYLSTSSTLRLNDSGTHQLLGLANREGVHVYALSGAPDGKFNHGIIWCGAAAIPFGFAMLE